MPYEAILNWAALVEMVIPSPATSWNTPNAFVAEPGAVMNPAGPMPPDTVIATDVPAVPTPVDTAIVAAVPPDTLTPAAVLETVTLMPAVMGRRPSKCQRGRFG